MCEFTDPRGGRSLSEKSKGDLVEEEESDECRESDEGASEGEELAEASASVESVTDGLIDAGTGLTLTSSTNAPLLTCVWSSSWSV
jgi:hypothetical protein